MQATMLRALVQVESNSSQQLPAAPARAVSRTCPSVPQPQQDEEDIMLRNFGRSSHDKSATSTPNMPLDNNPSSPNTPPSGEERDLEMMTGPGSGTPDAAEPADAVEVLPSLFDPPKNKYRLAACCIMSLLGGMIDSAPGALIPHMEVHYEIGYAIVSLIFVGNALGFIAAAPLVETLRRKLGRANSLAFSQACLACGFVPLVVPATPFPVICVAYFLLGFGEALALALNNVFCANLRDGTAMLGAMHGSYGLGGTIGPLVATALVSSPRLQGNDSAWGRYYYLTLALAVCSAGFGYWSFHGYEKESAPAPRPASASASASGPNHDINASAAQQPSTTEREEGAVEQHQHQQKQLPSMISALRSRVVVLGALFIFAYQGAEVSISGWVISFLIAARGGDPARVGYVTAGFWAGITIGRFALSPLGARGGGREKPFVYALIVGAAIFELLVWWVPNVAGEAVSLAVVGLLLGPVYPCSAAVFARNLLPSGNQIRGLGVISAFGSAGGAVAPFTTGLLAQAAGTFVLHPIAIGLFGVMALTWWGQPGAARKRTE